jgi:hypothetical protein
VEEALVTQQTPVEQIIVTVIVIMAVAIMAVAAAVAVAASFARHEPKLTSDLTSGAVR